MSATASVSSSPAAPRPHSTSGRLPRGRAQQVTELANVAGRRVFENFREELAKGKDLIAHRFPDIPNRIEILAAALKEGILEERSTIGSDPAGSPA